MSLLAIAICQLETKRLILRYREPAHSYRGGIARSCKLPGIYRPSCRLKQARCQHVFAKFLINRAFP
ncbi:hypothetical protein EMIT0215P_40057 [Pseudomonas serboccidentalis]